MLKITAVLSLMLIGNAIWAAGMSCDSCGSECASACGTRQFRSCCFNYLRKKRDPEIENKIWPHPVRDLKDPRTLNIPLVLVESMSNIPEAWLSKLAPEYRPHSRPRPLEDLNDQFQMLYD